MVVNPGFLLLAVGVFSSLVASLRLPDASNRRDFETDRSRVRRASDAIKCGEQGYLTTPSYAPIADNQTTSLETCRKWCNDMNEKKYRASINCQTIGYDGPTSLCIFYPTKLNGVDGLGFRPDSTSSTTFYDHRCSDSTPDCNVSSDVNLINNPNFDASDALIGPWLASPSNGIKIHPGRGNSTGVLFTGPAALYQYRGLCANTDYRFRVYYKVLKPDPQSNTTAAISLEQGDCAIPQAIYMDETFLGKWHTLECSFSRKTANSQIPDRDFLVLQVFSNNKNLKTIFSNPVLNQIRSPNQFKTIGPSLLDNGGFESGKLAPWEFGFTGKPGSDKYQVVTPGLPEKGGFPDSKYKFQFTGMGQYDYYYYYESLGDFSIRQTLNAATELGKPYLFTMEYQGIHTEGFYVSIGETSFDNDDTFFPRHRFTNKTGIYPRIFTGTGQVDILTIDWDARSEHQPRVNFTIFLDNLSIRKLADE